jgi:serine/threonine protein kinase/tetratricopeptide (TPR) repeat protein
VFEWDAALWRRVSPHLDRALGMPPDQRTGYLAALRTTDAEAAGELEALLTAHAAAAVEGFLERSPAPGVAAMPATGQTIGAYRLVAQIGRGGMGDVWLAEREDGRFQRRVAIKFLSHSLAGRGGEERFRREGGLLGRLTHPHIAQLIDAGVTDGGQPYLVIEHVDGEPIDGYCDTHRLGIEQRLELFSEVLAAVSEAHAHLIVHRDLKPANVLVAADGRVKLLDFGIAKLVDGPETATAETRLTRIGGWALTPEYAAPEQVAGGTITTATDIYALGVMLYELLSGRHPINAPANAPLELLKAVIETMPPQMSDAVAAGGDPATRGAVADARSTTPERLRSRLAGDLETIVHKAMKKEPAERYATAAALAEDLRRYLHHEPIAARPDSAAYRARKFARRNRAGVALAGLAFVAAVAGIVATTYQARIAQTERDYALRQLARAEAVVDLDHFLLTQAAPLGRPLEVSELLQRAEQIARRQSAASAESRVNLLLSIGDQYRSLDDTDRARDVLQLAYAEARATSDSSIRARSACALAGALVKGSELARARALVAEGMAALPEESRYALDRIYCLKRSSYVEREDGEAATAIARIQEARALHAESPYQSEIQELSLLIDAAESYSQAGRHVDAIPAFEHASTVMSKLGRDQTQQAGTLYNNWALSLDISGRPREAEAIYRRAIEISRSDDSDEAVSPMLLVNYGRALRGVGRLEDAARNAEEAYVRAGQKGFEVVVNQSLLLRATIYRQQGDVARSMAMLDEVEPRMRQALPAGHPAFGSILLERGLTAQAGGDVEAALRLIDEAYAIAEAARLSGGSADYAPRVLIRRAEVRYEAGRPSEAEADARLALDRLGAVLPPEALSTFRADAYLALGRALKAQGKNVEGDAALAEALRHLLSALGPDHPRTIELRGILGRAG